MPLFIIVCPTLFVIFLPFRSIVIFTPSGTTTSPVISASSLIVSPASAASIAAFSLSKLSILLSSGAVVLPPSVPPFSLPVSPVLPVSPLPLSPVSAPLSVPVVASSANAVTGAVAVAMLIAMKIARYFFFFIFPSTFLYFSVPLKTLFSISNSLLSRCISPLRLSASYIRTSSFEKNVKDAFLPLLQSGFSSRRHRFCRLSVSGDISKNEAKKRSLTPSSSPAYSFKKKRYRSFAAI